MTIFKQLDKGFKNWKNEENNYELPSKKSNKN